MNLSELRAAAAYGVKSGLIKMRDPAEDERRAAVAAWAVRENRRAAMAKAQAARLAGKNEAVSRRKVKDLKSSKYYREKEIASGTDAAGDNSSG